MKITTAWVDNGDGPQLISAYDELTEEVWSGVPPFFTDAIDDSHAEGAADVRRAVIEVPDDAISALFEPPTVTGAVTQTVDPA